MEVVIVAGETSGDIIAADLIQALRRIYPDSRFVGVAGPRMVAAGCEAWFPMESLAVMGLTEVLLHLPVLINIRQQVIKRCLKKPPQLFIGIDAPDFNLPLEEKLKAHGIKTVHYTSPSLWAWRPERIHLIKRAVDLMLTLFPFEVAIYQQHGVPVEFVGHPLADQVPFESDLTLARQALQLSEKGKIVALLPGSRSHEIKLLTPLFLQTAKQCLGQFPGVRFITPMVNEKRLHQFIGIKNSIANDFPITIFLGQAQNVMAAADVVLLASGTATLEAMLVKKPMVMAHRVSAFTYWWAKRKLSINQFALPNLLAGKNLVPEYIQDNATLHNLANAVMARLQSPGLTPEEQQDFNHLHQVLKKNASHVAAQAIAKLIASQ